VGRQRKEISQTLFIGERTVETHLGNVYAKLGVESELQLARRRSWGYRDRIPYPDPGLH
jgi:DNA-binding CsgD family transcriptional regulator